MARKSTKKVEAQESLKVEEATKFQFFKISDADGFAVIQIMDHRGVFPTDHVEVPDGIISYASKNGKFVFAGSKREAAARLSAVGYTEIKD